MSLRTILPDGVSEIPLLYLSLPELLVLEQEENMDFQGKEGIVEILNRPSFWRQRLEEYPAFDNDLSKSKNLRKEYHRLFFEDNIFSGNIFELGLLNLPFVDEDTLSSFREETIDEYLTGIFIGSRGKFQEGIRKQMYTSYLDLLDALHHNPYNITSVFQWEFWRGNTILYSREMIDNAIKTLFMHGNEILKTIIDHMSALDTPKQKILLEYFLNNYCGKVTQRIVSCCW